MHGVCTASICELALGVRQGLLQALDASDRHGDVDSSSESDPPRGVAGAYPAKGLGQLARLGDCERRKDTRAPTSNAGGSDGRTGGLRIARLLVSVVSACEMGWRSVVAVFGYTSGDLFFLSFADLTTNPGMMICFDILGHPR